MLLAAAVGAHAGQKAYIGLYKDNAVAVLDTATNPLLSTIAIPTGPHGLVVTPDGTTVFASSDGDSKVSVIDTATDAVSGTVQVGTSPHWIAATGADRTAYVTNEGSNDLSVVDLGTMTVIVTPSARR